MPGWSSLTTVKTMDVFMSVRLPECVCARRLRPDRHGKPFAAGN
jgi:hypothetical protein